MTVPVSVSSNGSADITGSVSTTVISAVMQKGIKLGERIVRPARVGVADPN